MDGHTVEEATEDSFRGMDIVLGAASNDLARRMAPHIKAAGAVFVDNSSAFRLMDDVPLVVPEINPEDAKSTTASSPTPQLLDDHLHGGRQRPQGTLAIEAITASTYQAVSGAGAGGLAELEAQARAYAAGRSDERRNVPLPDPLQPHSPDRFAVRKRLHHRGDEMQNEGRKILHLPEMKVTCTCGARARACARTPSV